jgi:photosystem II stability/assembly factor-like uncharacterized protein
MYSPAASPHDPNLIFMSCDMGGFYRTEDGGKTWRMVPWWVNQGSTVCRPIFHPTDANVVFASGKGLMVSRDRGVTWSALLQKAPWGDQAPRELGIDWGNPKLMFAGFANEAYVSSDAGKTWSKAAGVTGGALGFVVDQTSPADKRTCFVGTAAGIWRSDDGGRTWAEKTKGLPNKELHGFTGGTDGEKKACVLYCTVASKAVGGKFEGGVCRSTDGGETWVSCMGQGINATVGKKDEWGAGDIPQYEFIVCGEQKPAVVYVTNRGNGYNPPYHSTVYRSEDAGNSWKAVLQGDPRWEGQNVELDWITCDMMWGWGGEAEGFNINRLHPEEAMFTDSGRIFITDDGGKRWRQACSLRAPGQGEPGKGQRWGSIGLEVTTTWDYVFDPHAPDRTYICYTDIGFARSTDRGQTWYYSPTGSPWGSNWYALVADPEVPGRLYGAATNRHDIPNWTNVYAGSEQAPGGVVVSDDYGATWKPANEGLPACPVTALVLDPKSPKEARVLFAACYGQGIYKTADSGKTWQKTGEVPTDPRNRHFYGLCLHPSGSLFATVTANRYQDRDNEFVPGGLFRSDDGGKTWRSVMGNLTLHWATNVAVDPRDANVIYLGAYHAAHGLTEGGLYKTTDGGATWRRILEKGWVFAPILHPKNPDVVYVTTYDSDGIWRSPDGGKTWQPVKGIPFQNINRITFDPKDENVIYVTTFGGGVWRGPAEGTEAEGLR